MISRIEYGSPEYEAEVKLREEVLRKPLGLSFTVQTLEADRDDVHLGAFEAGVLVGCLILKELPEKTLKMRQVAVSPLVQGRGVGKKLVLASEQYAKKNGYLAITLAARETAIPFYQTLGYEIFGEPFTEVSLPHRMMRKQLI